MERKLSKTRNELDDVTVGDDGLTDHERQFISTPVSEMDPESVKFGVAMLDKRADHNWRENEEYRRHQEATREHLA